MEAKLFYRGSPTILKVGDLVVFNMERGRLSITRDGELLYPDPKFEDPRQAVFVELSLSWFRNSSPAMWRQVLVQAWGMVGYHLALIEENDKKAIYVVKVLYTMQNTRRELNLRVFSCVEKKPNPKK